MKKNLSFLQNALTKQHFYWTAGVESIWSVKWLLIAFLYIMGAGLMALDKKWFGEQHFNWDQGVFVVLLAFVIISTLAFEWHLLGKSSGINLFLQILLMLPFTLFLARIIGKPSNLYESKGPIIDIIMKGKEILYEVGFLDLLPKWTTELFSSTGLAVLFLLVCAALSFGQKKSTKCGLLFSAFLWPLASTFVSQPFPSPFFIAGSILMFVGMNFQFLDVSKYVRDLNILERLKDVTDEAERQCTLRILNKTFNDGKISETTILETVRRCYTEQHGFPEELNAHNARLLCRRLVYEHRLLTVKLSNDGMLLEPVQNLMFYDSILAEIALWPRSFILGIIALIWCLSPIDLIPDAIPIVGIIDDMIVMWLGTIPLLNQLKRKP